MPDGPVRTRLRARRSGHLHQVIASVTYVIAQPCVDVMELSCVAVCPVDCIHYEPGVDRMLYIDPDECIDCAACETECSVAAIHAEDAVPVGEEPYIEVNALWFADRAAARARVDQLVPR